MTNAPKLRWKIANARGISRSHGREVAWSLSRDVKSLFTMISDYLTSRLYNHADRRPHDHATSRLHDSMTLNCV